VGFLPSDFFKMAAINEYRGSSESPDPHQKGYGKEYGPNTVDISGGPELEEDSTGQHLHRGLKARQITMIAIGGAIGTGLIIGTYVMSDLQIAKYEIRIPESIS
jgi:amino acid transporter